MGNNFNKINPEDYDENSKFLGDVVTHTLEEIIILMAVICRQQDSNL